MNIGAEQSVSLKCSFLHTNERKNVAYSVVVAKAEVLMLLIFGHMFP